MGKAGLRSVVAALVLACGGVGLSAEETMSGGPAIWMCFVPETTFSLMERETFTDKQTGAELQIVRGDRNYDGAQDMMLFYSVREGKSSVFPVYYIIDKTFTGQPTEAWVDTQGNGRCQDMKSIPIGEILQDPPNSKEA